MMNVRSYWGVDTMRGSEAPANISLSLVGLSVLISLCIFDQFICKLVKKKN